MSPDSASHSILFVCTGNICRSPTAEGLFRHQMESLGVRGRFRIDSAGTGGWHEGDPPDHRAIAEALRRGVRIGDLRARALRRQDYEEFGLMVAMDSSHFDHMQRHKPESAPARIQMLLAEGNVPDPYYGGAAEFRKTYDIIAQGIDDLIKALREQKIL